MSGVITSSSFAKLLWPGLNSIYGKEIEMEYPLGECKSCDALADQIAELTKTNLAQAAQIEMMRKHSALLVEAYNFGQFADDFNQPQARTIRKAIRETCEAIRNLKELS